MGNLKPFSEYGKNLKEVDWLVSNMLTAGGTSLLAGDPKSGKSQFVRHLISSLLNKIEFLNCQISDVDKIIYLALEETPNELKKYINDLGIDDTRDDLIIGDRAWSTGKDNISELEADIKKFKPLLCVIDTFVAYSDINDMNDYAKVYKALQAIAQIARQENCHILIVHHKNKGDASGTKSIMGSQAFFGAVDSALLLSGEGDQKTLNIAPRYTARREIKFTMSPSEITNVTDDLKDISCAEALLNKVKTNKNGYEFRNFSGFSKQAKQAAKSQLIEEGLVQEVGGSSGKPKMLYLNKIHS